MWWLSRSSGRVSMPKSMPVARPFWLLDGRRLSVPNTRVNAAVCVLVEL